MIFTSKFLPPPNKKLQWGIDNLTSNSSEGFYARSKLPFPGGTEPLSRNPEGSIKN
jgi:hypothetical protein